MSTSSTPTPPAWLEAAAKLDALTGTKVPLSAARNTAVVDEADEEEFDGEAGVPEDGDKEVIAQGAEDREGSTAAVPRDRASVEIESSPPEPNDATNRINRAEPRSRMVPAAFSIPKPVAAEEGELAWHGYSAQALLPSTVALAVVTAGIIVGLRPLVPAWVVHEGADAPLAALWIFQAFRAGYRLVGYNYRLTTRRLFRDRGRLYPPEGPVDLCEWCGPRRDRAGWVDCSASASCAWSRRIRRPPDRPSS